MKIKLNVGESQVISTCKRDTRSTWGNGNSRTTSKGMNEVVTISKNNKGQKISTTTYVSKKTSPKGK